MLLLSLEREVRPEPEPVPVPPAPSAAALKRDRRIKLFDMDAPAAAAADPARGSDTGQEEASVLADAPAAEPGEIEPGQGEEIRTDATAAAAGEETSGFVGRIRALFR